MCPGVYASPVSGWYSGCDYSHGRDCFVTKGCSYCIATASLHRTMLDPADGQLIRILVPAGVALICTSSARLESTAMPSPAGSPARPDSSEPPSAAPAPPVTLSASPSGAH